MNEKGYKKLLAWQAADELAFAVYEETKNFPKEEQFGVTSQLRRAALSVALNLAEGWDRQNRNEKRQFANIALGSLAEVENLLDFCLRLCYFQRSSFDKLNTYRERTGALLWKLHQSL